MKHNYTSSFQRAADDGASEEWDKLYWYDKWPEKLKEVQNLFEFNGFEIHLTSGCYPEQYDVFVLATDVQAGYLRLRNGKFRVDYPDCGDKTIYEASPKGQGKFEDNERMKYMGEAIYAIIKKINSEPTVQECDATKAASSTEAQKQKLINIMDEDQKDGLYDDTVIPKELDDWAIATAMDSFQDAADKPIMDILLRGTFYRGECAAIKKLMPEIERFKLQVDELIRTAGNTQDRLILEIERLKKALQQIEQMSDPGDYEKAIADMKSIASNALNFKP